REIGGAQAGEIGRLKSRVVRRRTPSCPPRSAGQGGADTSRRRRAPAGGRAGHVFVDLLAGDIFGDRTAIGSAQLRALGARRAVDGRFDDGLRRARFQRVERGRPRVGLAVVTRRAARREDLIAGRRLRGADRRNEHEGRQKRDGFHFFLMPFALCPLPFKKIL